MTTLLPANAAGGEHEVDIRVRARENSNGRTRARATPLRVGVTPREFDGLPSAGAAPALRPGTQE